MKYCDKCKRVATKDSHKKFETNNPRTTRTRDLYFSNIVDIADAPYKLIPREFNLLSSISVNSYCNYFRLSWIDILKKTGMYDLLFDYIVSEYEEYVENTPSRRKQGFKSFSEKHRYIDIEICKKIGTSEIRSATGVTKLRYSDEDLRVNIISIKDKLNKIPLYNEFISISNITIPVYAKRLKLKGKVYDEVVKYYFSEEEYLSYLEDKKEHKSKVGSITGALSATYNDEDYKNEFIKTFEYCKEKYGQYPSRRLFNEISKIDDRSYRKKYTKSFTEIAEMYGYKIEKTSNKSEKLVLDLISKITSSAYEPQKKFSWLIGVNNYPLSCDGYYEDLDLVVEFDGQHHYEPIEAFGGKERFEIQVNNDKIKDDLIPKNKLKLLRISCYEPFWDESFITKKLVEFEIIK